MARKALYIILFALFACSPLFALEDFKRDEFSKGLESYNAGRLDEAREHFINSFTMSGPHPDDFEGKLEAHIYLARIEREKHNWESAKRWLRSVSVLTRRYGTVDQMKYWNDKMKPIYHSIAAMEQLEQEMALAKAEVDRKVNIIICVVLGFVLLILLIVSYLLWKLGRAYKSLASKNKEISKVAMLDLSGQEDELCLKIYDYMKETKCYLREDFTLEALADGIGVNRTYTSGAVGRMSTNFRSLVNGFRISEAISMLNKNRTATVEEISAACGFSNPRTFYNAFKTITGLTPSEFRRSL